MNVKIPNSSYFGTSFPFPKIRLDGYSRGDLSFLNRVPSGNRLPKSDITLSIAMEGIFPDRSGEIARVMDFNDAWTEHVLLCGRQTGKTWMHRAMLRTMQTLTCGFILTRLARHIKLISGIQITPQPILDTYVEKLFKLRRVFEWTYPNMSESQFDTCHIVKPYLR